MLESLGECPNQPMSYPKGKFWKEVSCFSFILHLTDTGNHKKILNYFIAANDERYKHFGIFPQEMSVMSQQISE